MTGGRLMGTGLLERVARLVVARPRTVLAVWSAAAAIGALLASGLLGQLSNRGFFVPGAESDKAAHALAAHFPGQEGTPLVAVVTKRGDDAWTEAQAIALVRRALRGTPGVVGIRRSGEADRDREDGTLIDRTTLVSFNVRKESAAAEQAVPDYRSALQRASEPATDVHLFGGVVVTQRFSEIARSDLQRAERIAFPFTLVVLLVAFVSVVAALVPLALAAVVLVVTFACLYLLGRHAGLSVFVTNTSSILALALSIDFSLFMITRLREEVAQHELGQAVVRTMASTGRAISLSAATIATALLALLAVGVELFSSMAIGATLATLVAALAALTLLPAVLVLLGPRVDWLAIDPVARAVRRATLWHRLADVVTRRPLTCVLVVTALMVAAALPALSFGLALHTVSSLPKDDPVRRDANHVARVFFPGAPAPIQLVTTHRQIPRALWDDPDVAQTTGETDGSDGWFALQILLDRRPDDARARSAVVRLRRLLRRSPGTTYLGGATPAAVDLLDRVDERTPLVVLLTVGAGMLVLCAGLRSLVIPVKALLGTLLSVAATTGIVLRLFPGSSLEFFVPLFLFAIVFGLSVDYEVFLLSRVREAATGGETTADAVRRALVLSARPITLAGIAMATVFAGLATSDLVAFQQLGVGLAIAIVLDVTLVRCVLAPAGVLLLGRWNWWFFGFGAMRARPPASALRRSRSAA
ncbi:MAG TPA: MMPL family transporter [Conexibacter sp.]|nr:MMPL family transporter [Conexibacter sp.]